MSLSTILATTAIGLSGLRNKAANDAAEAASDIQKLNNWMSYVQREEQAKVAIENMLRQNKTLESTQQVMSAAMGKKASSASVQAMQSKQRGLLSRNIKYVQDAQKLNRAKMELSNKAIDESLKRSKRSSFLDFGTDLFNIGSRLF